MSQTNPTPNAKALADYWKGLEKTQKDQLADDTESTYGYLRQVFLYGKAPGAKMASRLSQNTGLSRAQFRPDIFEHE